MYTFITYVFPGHRYESLRNHTYEGGSGNSSTFNLSAKEGQKRLPIPSGVGSLDVLVSFEVRTTLHCARPAPLQLIDASSLEQVAVGSSGFGLSVRSGTVKVEVVSVHAAVAPERGHSVTVAFFAGPQPCTSTHGQPPCTAPPTPPAPVNATLSVLPVRARLNNRVFSSVFPLTRQWMQQGETIDLRALVDRPIVELYVNLRVAPLIVL